MKSYEGATAGILIERDEQHCLLLYVHICILETTLCLIYPCEQMEGIVCMYIMLRDLYNITMTWDSILSKTSASLGSLGII